MTDKEVVELSNDLAQLKNVIRQKLAEIRQLEHHLGLALKSKYGHRRERFDPTQHTRFELGEAWEAEPEDVDEKITVKRRPRHDRHRLLADWPRKRVEHDLLEAKKACPCCGKQRQRIGFEISERIEWKPAD